MDEFLQVFGDLTVGTVVIIIVALGFLYKLYTVSKNHMIERYKKEEEREHKLRQVIEQAEKYPEWHKQSLEIQKQFSEAITAIKEEQLKSSKSLERLTTQIAEGEATDSRYRILRFNDEILHDEKHTKEHFDQILDDITRYEKYCDEHPEYENNKAVLAIENVERVYKKCSDENLFL
jgi:hypothetical protein